MYELRGRGEWINDRWDGASHPLRAGDVIESEDGLRMRAAGERSSARPSATASGSISVPVSTGSADTRAMRAARASEDVRALVTADSHAGGWRSGGLEVLPLGTRCRTRLTASPAIYEVRRRSVRVLAGVVVARAAGHSVHVRTGEEAAAVCASASRCRLLGPRVLQPGEPCSTSLAEPAPRFHEVVSAPAGSRPPARALAPPFSEVVVYRLRGSRSAPEQLAVHWSRAYRRASSPTSDTQYQSGVWIWQRVAVVQAQGSGGCGPRVFAAWAAGRERTLVARNEWESEFRLQHGALVVDEPVGPCPYWQASAHCFGGTRHVVMRWRGAQLVERRATVACGSPRLDPRRDCRWRR